MLYRKYNMRNNILLRYYQPTVSLRGCPEWGKGEGATPHPPPPPTTNGQPLNLPVLQPVGLRVRLSALSASQRPVFAPKATANRAQNQSKTMSETLPTEVTEKVHKKPRKEKK